MGSQINHFYYVYSSCNWVFSPIDKDGNWSYLLIITMIRKAKIIGWIIPNKIAMEFFAYSLSILKELDKFGKCLDVIKNLEK